MLGRGREKGNRARGEKEKVAPAASPLFISSRPFINMQTANIHDQSIKMLFTFCGNLERASKGISDRKKVKTVKRGCPKKENCANDICIVCQTNLRAEYGSNTGKSFMNLFKPALRNESFGIVWAVHLRNISGHYGLVGSSQVACNVCLRKIKNLLLQSIHVTYL